MNSYLYLFVINTRIHHSWLYSGSALSLELNASEMETIHARTLLLPGSGGVVP